MIVKKRPARRQEGKGEKIGRRNKLRIRIVAQAQVTAAELLKPKAATFASRIKSLGIVHATQTIRQFLPS
jgi:hypothetical protein